MAKAVLQGKVAAGQAAGTAGGLSPAKRVAME